MSSTVNAADSRINVLIRIMGIAFLAFGATMTYLTYSEAASAALQPPLVPVLYLCSSMLVLAGIVALISKYKESVAPKGS